MTNIRGMGRDGKTRKAKTKNETATHDAAQQIAEFREEQWIREQLQACQEGYRQAFQGIQDALQAHVEANDSAGIVRCATWFQAQETTLQRALSLKQQANGRTGVGEGQAGLLAAFAEEEEQGE